MNGDDLRAAGFVPDQGVITAGFPCQDVSLAGVVKAWVVHAADCGGTWCDCWLTAARWVVAENVPGLLSSNGRRDFGAVLGSLVQLGYGVAYRVLDAQYFGVPQRRERVFIVGHLGEPWHAPAEVLFEPESGTRDFAPSETPGESSAYTLYLGALEPVDFTGGEAVKHLAIDAKAKA